MIKNYSDYLKIEKTKKIVDNIIEVFNSDDNFKKFKCTVRQGKTSHKEDYKLIISFLDNDGIIFYEISVFFGVQSENLYVITINGDSVDCKSEICRNYINNISIFIYFIKNIKSIVGDYDENKFLFINNIYFSSDDILDMDQIISYINPNSYHIFKDIKKFNL